MKKETIFSFGLVLTNKCIHNCFNCEGESYIYRDMKEESFVFLENFAKEYPSEFIIAGKEIMLEPEKVERFLNIRSAKQTIITTGITAIDKLDSYVKDYDNIQMILLSCHGSPDVERFVRNDVDKKYDYESRKWILKYKDTPLYDLFFLNHVIYRHNIEDGRLSQGDSGLSSWQNRQP